MNSTPITNPEVIKTVQRRLFELGIVNADYADGELAEKTQASILDFRNRNGLPLVPQVDDEFLLALANATPIVVSERQASVTAEQIAPKVEAVAATKEVAKASWWSKFTAWITGIPSAIILVVSQFDPVLPIITPVKALFAEVPWQIWLGGFAGLCVVFAVQAHRTSAGAQKTEDAIVDGYKQGTVKFDKVEKVPEDKAAEVAP